MAQDRESHFRSIAKGLTWRILATFTTATIAYFVTGSIKPALAIGGVEFFLKFMIYYGHERAWATVPHGTFHKWERRFFKKGSSIDSTTNESNSVIEDDDTSPDAPEPSTINN